MYSIIMYIFISAKDKIEVFSSDKIVFKIKIFLGKHNILFW